MIGRIRAARLTEPVATGLRTELEQLTEQPDYQALVLSFSDVEFLSSTAISILVVIMRGLAQRQRQLVLCDMRPAVRQVFRLLQLDSTMFAIHETLEEALASVSQTPPLE